MRVCHMTSVHAGNDVRIFQKECASLAAAGHEVYLVAPGESREEKGVRVVGIGPKPARRIQRMSVFVHKVYKAALALDCDVYHFHDPELLPYGLKLKKKGKRVVFDSHEFYSLQILEKHYIPTWLRKLISNAYRRYELRICRRLDAIVCVCTVGGKNYFADAGTRVIMLRNLPFLHDVQRLTATTAEKEANTIVYAGGLSPDRGIAHLADAVSLVQGAKLVLCGKFISGAFEEMMRSKGTHISYLGVLGRDEVFELYGRCYIGAATVLNVGQFGILDTLLTKVYEYMAAGLPVILSDTPYNRAVIKQHRFGLCVDPENPEEIARAIAYLCEHPEEAAEMGENGKRAVLTEYNWDIESKKLLALYAALGGNGG